MLTYSNMVWVPRATFSEQRWLDIFSKLTVRPTAGFAGAPSPKPIKGYKVKTLTYDNGLEFARHAEISKELKARGYFCAPYHSWEKGGVENFNGLVRQYFPKGSDFREISSSTLRWVEDEINQRPRKTLNYKSPSELETKLAA